MLLLIILAICLNGIDCSRLIKPTRTVAYDCYTGEPASNSQIQLFTARNITNYCVINVRPCDENYWRRTDGSCNNLRYPSRGMIRTPTTRVLTPDFSPNYEPRKTKNNEDLPLARYLRTQILPEGKASDLDLTQLVAYVILFALNDVNTIHDILNYVHNTTDCCTPEGKLNYICTPNKIPLDDPVHRFSGVRCQNLTRPQTFQYFGCADFGPTPFARIEFGTPLFDIGNVYGNALDAIDKQRTYNKGGLKYEIDHGKIFPLQNPNFDPNVNLCLSNQLPLETRCHFYQVNGVLGPNIFSILYYRQHNYIAAELARMNPCWDDDRIFYTAKDINIAIHVQIYYYELLPILLGRSNLILDGVISCDNGFRDLYDENISPQVSDEYIYIKRWFHIIQETDLKMYDTDGYYLKTIPLVNVTARTGFLPLDNNLEEIFQGSFRQPSGRFDRIVDPDMAERVLGDAQFASDVTMNDLAKGRYFGFQPYVKYRQFCDKQSYTTFDSLTAFMTRERVNRLSLLYENVEDIELMAATWVENHIPGGRVPYTVYCLMVEQLKRSTASDRHWYERPNRPHAFTLDQLLAIRKATVAGVLCTNADGVTKIQPNAFYTISPNNPLTDCSSPNIGTVDLSPWQDPSCVPE